MENNDSYVRFETSLTSLKSLLGIECIRWYRSEYTDPYILRILEWLNRELRLSGASGLWQVLSEFTRIYEESMEEIISENLSRLLYKMRISESEDGFRVDLFCTVFGNFMMSLYTTLMYNYANAFPEEPYDCHKCNCSGSDTDLSGYDIPHRPSWESEKVGCGCKNKGGDL
jgi:hypothetical protein